MAGGRPTLYRPEYCQALIEHMAKGFSFETFGADIEVDEKTLYNWLDKHEEFFQAQKTAKLRCQKFWEELGIKYIIGTEETGKLNNAIWIFNMKNRFRWRDQVDINQTTVNIHEHKLKQQLDQVSTPELIALAEQTIQQLTASTTEVIDAIEVRDVKEDSAREHKEGNRKRKRS